MSIIISYNRYQYNWYVGELYHFFANHMSSLYGNIQIKSLSDMAKEYNEPLDVRENTLASVFNIYSLIVHNTDTNVSFLHSLADYAPVILEHKDALQKLNVKAFAFCSHHTQEVINRYKNDNINLIPSFYILENWNDHNLISEYKNVTNKQKSCYFNGLCYGHREHYVNHLKNNPFFVMRNKSKLPDYRSKKDYYQELSEHKYGLSINGVAQICYRDLEYFGMGSLCIREPMSLITKDNLQENVHYKTILDNFVRNNIYYPEKKEEVAQYIIDKINNISDEEEKYILNNASNWFDNNALPDKQIKFLHDCLIKNSII